MDITRLEFQSADDPTGNGIPSVQAMYRDENDNLVESGLFFKFHGATIQGYQRASNGGEVFALNPSDDKAIINQL